MFLFYFTTIDYIIKTGSDLMTFGLLKEWAEDTVFLFREDEEGGGRCHIDCRHQNQFGYFKIYTIKFMCEQITIYYCSPEILFRKHFLF